jgi:hypothetical protein
MGGRRTGAAVLVIVAAGFATAAFDVNNKMIPTLVMKVTPFLILGVSL